MPKKGAPPAGMLMLLDAASLYFRSFHGIPEGITAPDGTAVNAVRGFLDTIAYLTRKRHPARLVACWDEDWRPAFRTAAIPSYKAHRAANLRLNIEEVPKALQPQIPLIADALALLGIARVGIPGHEADDVIGVLATREVARAAAAGVKAQVEVITGDRDLFQLVDDAGGVTVCYVGRGVRNLEEVDEAWLSRKYGVRGGRAYAEMAMLRGDPSDGLPGVEGIGEKTAVGLLNRFGSLDALRAAAADPSSDLSAAQRKRLQAASDYLDVAPAVVLVASDAAVDDVDDALPATPPDHEKLIAFAQKWGLESSLGRVVSALPRPA
jgi:5'-3' exonuclease